jgi:hypothetical protein
MLDTATARARTALPLGALGAGCTPSITPSTAALAYILGHQTERYVEPSEADATAAS